MAIDLDVHGNTKPLEAAVQAAVNRIRRQPIKITVDDKGATQPLGNMKRGADEFTKSMEAANARILAFGASMAIINGVANAFKGMVKNLVEVEKAMADVNVVMGLSAQNLEKFSDGLFKVAKETGAAFRVAADAATEYARQGLGVEESLKRTRDALVLTRLTGMDSAEAVKSLTAAMNTYGTQIKDTTQLVSKFAAVDVKFAVSAQDFADAISRTGQSAQSAGVSIDELVGIVTAAQQKTARGGAVIGNALKTIFTKTGKTDTLNQLENLGIAVRDLEGNTIGAQRILNDLANTFDTLSAAQKAQITQTMGGLFHINILKAVLSDAAKQNGIMAEATRISAGATDEAIQKNEELRKTMSAVATETGLAIKQVSTQIGEIAIAPGMEKILNSVKSLAEGLSGVLGDGESTGSSFATGLLKGIGNVITGPGLVVLAGVFFKLFGQALKFTKESLTSLVGVTTEKQKQKAIQTSLVSLFGQNAALNKEMLRTDIGRTEKEKIILGLLKAQNLEAKSLSTLTAGMAGTLYRKGYGANLTPVGKKASGHIPNYANPERAQAAQGGYAAGNIRSMNMPGEGSVIYNSAEKVKNFKGMSQPAIMPPHSSKAGKNYQQAFGNIHGFDPYAAGGYVPNFAGPRTHVNQGSAKYIGLSATNSADRAGTLYATAGKGMSNVFSSVGKPYREAAAKSKGAKIDYEFYSLDDSEKRKYYDSKVEDELKEDLQRASYGIMNKLLKTLSSKDQNFIAKKADLSKDLPENKMSVAAGHIFEAASKTILREIGAESAIPDSETARIDFFKNDKLYDLFGVKGAKGSVGAEAKINSNEANAKSFARKIYDLEIGGKGITSGSKTSALLKTKADRDKFESWVVQNKGQIINGVTIGKTGNARYNMLRDKNKKDRLLESYESSFKSKGFIPNFADPLSDAIGREKAAGVPVSQIRVGSHGALMGKGNPLGLGVTNTHDEPNGLRDVFGANGFVPNYAAGDSRVNIISKLLDKWKSVSQTSLSNTKQELIEDMRINTTRRGYSAQETAEDAKQLGFSKQETKEALSQLNFSRKETKQALTSTFGAGGLAGLNKKFEGTTMGRALGSTGGQMGLMMGAPMLAGMLQQGGATKGGAGYTLGGALQGAGTGASMGMIFGPIGTAVGALGGAFMGLVNSAKEVEEAQVELAKSTGAQKSQSILSAPVMQQAFAGIGEERLESLVNLKKQLKLGSKFEPSFTEIETRKENLDKKFDNKQLQQSAMMVWGGGSSLNISKSISEDKIEKDASEITSVLNTDTAKERRQALVGALKKLDPSTEFMGTDLKGEVGEDGKKIFKSKKFTTSSFLSQIEGLDITKLEDQEALRQAFENALTLQQKINIDKEKERKAVILQLNAQRAILAAQQKAKEIQFDIKSSYAQIDSSLSLQAKLMGSFATEQQKAQMNYTKAVNKAAEKYATGAQSQEDQYRVSMIKFSEDATIAAALKTNLAQRKVNEAEISGEGNTLDLDTETKKIDLTKELLKLSNEELYTELKKANLVGNQLQALEDFKNSKEKNVEMLLKELGLSTKIAESEFAINDAIAKRKDLLANMSTAIGMSDKQLAHDQKMRGFSSQLAAAQRLTDVGPGYQTRAQQEDFQMREKQISLENAATTLRGNATSAINKKIKERTDLELQQQVAQERVSAIKGGAKPTTAEEQKELEALLVEQQQALAFIDHEIKNINESTKEEISNAQKLLDLEKQRLDEKRKHETGPGAFKNGLKDGMAQLREDTLLIDYQLSRDIPQNFANGLASAMTEALSGAKDLDDALRDAGIAFLKTIQQAMMQKAANNIVGMLPFSRGGNVRKYSQGGGVPAMVSDGEYVMSGGAVNKYGGAFMHGLNAGGNVPTFSNGGKLEGFQYKSGRAYQSKKMSGAFYGRADNVGLREDASSLEGALADKRAKEEEAIAKAKEEAAKYNARVQQIVSTVASIAMAGVTAGMQGSGKLTGTAKAAGYGSKTPFGVKMATDAGGQAVSLLPNVDTSGFSNVTNTRSWNPMSWKSPSSVNPGLGPFFWNKPTNQYYGGPIRQYANGGHISGKSGIDQIPAMLSEGEYVIRASSARQIGKPMLDRINAGKFNDGGPVDKIVGSEETSGTSGNTNNINISVNIESGSVKDEKKSSDNTSVEASVGGKEKESGSAIADKIKQQVLSVIVEEQRPGGLLSD
jgi:TP901 family phage tail tape measure protein